MSDKISSQVGRSMQEILAVIVIICLLTFGGMELYSKMIVMHEGDNIHQDILTTVSSIRSRGAGRPGTQSSGIADTQLAYNKTRSGKEMQVVTDCPKDAFTIKIKNVSEKLCEYLTDKEYPDLFQPLAFYRAEDFEEVCSGKKLGTDTTGYYMMQGTDCSQISEGVFALAFDWRGKAKKIKACKDDTDCYLCQKCDNTKGVCVDDCALGYVCSKETQQCEKDCEEGQYRNEEGVCVDCPAQTSCNPDHTFDEHGCAITPQECTAGETYCDGDECVPCPDPEDTICSGTPETDDNACPTQKLEPCSSNAPFCATNNTCYCPEYAVCPDPNDPNNPFSCETGYCPAGETCSACACEGYPLTTCPTGGNCSECLSGETIKYKLDSCNSGYYKEGDGCTACDEPTEEICYGYPTTDVHGCFLQVKIECSGTTPVCNTTNNTCYCPEHAVCPDSNNPNNPFSCKTGYCPVGETCPACSCTGYPLTACPTGGNCSTCLSGTTTKYKLNSCNDGYTLSGNTCVANACDGYPLTVCPTGGNCSTCLSGTTTKYKLNSCNNGYTLSGNTCVANTCDGYPLTSCTATNGTCSSCQTPTGTKYKLSCNNGYTPSGSMCVANACDGYPLTACPTGGNCSTCLSGTTTKYKLNSCNNGYTLSGNTCTANACTGYTLTTCPTNGNCSTCLSGTTTKYRLDSCTGSYVVSGNSCISNETTGGSWTCKAGSYFNQTLSYQSNGSWKKSVSLNNDWTCGRYTDTYTLSKDKTNRRWTLSYVSGCNSPNSYVASSTTFSEKSLNMTRTSQFGNATATCTWKN